VTTDRRVKLLDFGIAKQLEELGDSSPNVTRTGLRLMTPAYAAPEQIRGERVGIDTDVYSLGCDPVRAARRPTAVRSDESRARGSGATSTRRPARATVGGGSADGASAGPSQRVPFVKPREWADLDVLCLTAMHRDSTRRYRSVDAFDPGSRQLRERGAAAGTSEIRHVYRVNKFVTRHWHAVAAVAGLLIAVVALTAVYTIGLRNARNAAQAERDRANHQSVHRHRDQPLPC
jgi:serine/threonine-protein kinase